jgi:hypothetical protein
MRLYRSPPSSVCRETCPGVARASEISMKTDPVMLNPYRELSTIYPVPATPYSVYVCPVTMSAAKAIGVSPVVVTGSIDGTQTRIYPA